ncbi:unnamed protein product [Miscanthus lutarioriparius]|uniref:Uncharacterized protein n=1 Tax=Miscanthus lutarioriparius TaxID=422564 RepID=A0A811SJ72_9POAL|nr:unnamed protein product [Miscanthus lutarioriparius]
MKKFYGDHYQVELDEFVTIVKKLYNFYVNSAPTSSKKINHDLEEFLYDASEPAMVESNELERYIAEPLLKIVDSKMVGSIVSDLEVEALANVVAKLKIEEKDKEGDEEAKDMKSDPDLMDDANEL